MKQDTERHVLGQFQRMHDEMERLFESLMPGHRLPARQRCLWCPPTDVYETPSAAVVKVEIAGVDEDDFNISFADNTLTVAGVRRDREKEQRAYQQMEIWSGPFRTQVYIPWRVEADAIEAHYTDGFLVVRLPKESQSAKRVPVRADEE